MEALKSALIGLVVGLATVIAALPSKDPLSVYAEAYKQGRIDALRVRYANGNPNWELEQVCVAMWSEKQEVKK